MDLVPSSRTSPKRAAPASLTWARQVLLRGPEYSPPRALHLPRGQLLQAHLALLDGPAPPHALSRPRLRRHPRRLAPLRRGYRLLSKHASPRNGARHRRSPGPWCPPATLHAQFRSGVSGRWRPCVPCPLLPLPLLCTTGGFFQLNSCMDSS